ncbi:NADP-dependent oxidoreductase [Mycobacteroides abscessus]|uniref:NADP-dependent oxidoreductase n=1 Tax=Mycobacteroides abscessus TaxID=36809 RepID=UPI00026838E7|nr:putative oxidoreductase [Mycobacteroides abscessus 4S-0303]EIT93072.1 putative oxidoreductase [Mycobacteroides abscessus 4S-0726-RB]EIT96616.1 putative oxidoreductase [Mycobacteroides abscessus 4S-0726-RA]EIV47568.1 putative oxidoreductase [Mycobacteroides abscessus 4S-0116-R]EIV61049.1 putative oxidoreductase [Mycobacteroides abscessus 4S-0116-S]MBN7438840.1 NADP-dependent oxidoreductase [Mycobacteroides abscessus subsp. abscessus]PVB36272.1 NADP-dependent oxidoreductase [Mycobacteroides 
MTTPTNRLFRLHARPQGQVTEKDLELVEESITEINEGQALVRTLYLSLDPTNRVWMSELRSYIPPVELGAVMRGLGVGQVVESRRDDLPVGAFVLGFTGWQDYCVADDSILEFPFTVLPDPLPAPLPAFLGVLGHTGISAFIGVEMGDPQPGETVVVSAAAGAVGSIAGQLAKQRGARVVGIAGGAEKCRHLVEELGFDACVDRHSEEWRELLDAATPDGIDVDFENVGGPIMDHVLSRLNVGARVSLCGLISEYDNYNEHSDQPGLRNVNQLLMQRTTLRGFIVTDHVDRYGEIIGKLATALGEGSLTYDETIVEGLENARETLNQALSGGTRGKAVIKVV